MVRHSLDHCKTDSSTALSEEYLPAEEGAFLVSTRWQQEATTTQAEIHHTLEIALCHFEQKTRTLDISSQPIAVI